MIGSRLMFEKRPSNHHLLAGKSALLYASVAHGTVRREEKREGQCSDGFSWQLDEALAAIRAKLGEAEPLLDLSVANSARFRLR